MMEMVVTTGTMKRAKLQSIRHHQQTNTQLLTGQILFLSPSQSTEKRSKSTQKTPSAAGPVLAITWSNCVGFRYFWQTYS